MTVYEVRRGDERLLHGAKTRVSGGVTCTVHGQRKPCRVISNGEYFLACPDCIDTSPLIGPILEVEAIPAGEAMEFGRLTRKVPRRD